MILIIICAHVYIVGSFDDIPAYNPLDKRCSYIPEIPVNPAVILDGEHHKSDSILIVIVLTISSVVVVVVVLFIGATIPIYKWLVASPK